MHKVCIINTIAHYLRYAIVAVAALLCLPQRLSAQAIEAGYGKGAVLKFDDWLTNDALKQQDAQSFWLGYIYQTHSDENCGYASDFNYPTFTFGLLVSDFNNVRLRYNPRGTRPISYDSRCGTSFTAYASIRRAFFRTRSGWSADYRFSNGIGYNTHIYNRYNNVDNVLLGSRLAVYFDVALALNYHYRQYEFFIGPEFRHLSNGGVIRPNKGINKAGIGVGMRYHLQPYDSISFKRIQKPFDDKKMYLNIAYSSGLRGSQGEWLYDANNYIWRDNNVEDIKYGKDGYRLCHYHLVSTDLMFRYARRYASGIGIDALYEPYNRNIEIQNPKADRSDMSKWSFGIAAKHEVFFRRISMQVALGWYLSRPLNSYSNTTEEYPYYERVGIRYNLPWLNNSISVGYNIYAHLTKAYGSELVIDFKLPIFKLH
jgi:hypothetical protein